MADDRDLDDAAAMQLLVNLYKLIDQLAVIGHDFDQATTDVGKRQNVLAYLQAFVAHLELLRTEGVFDGEKIAQALAVPQALTADIENIHERRQTVFLERPKGEGPLPKPFQHEYALAWASAAVDYLVEIKRKKEKEAASHVVRAINRRKLALHRASSTSLLDYRGDLRAERRPPELKKRYHEARAIIWEIAASRDFDAALDHALYIIGRVCGKKQPLPEESVESTIN